MIKLKSHVCFGSLRQLSQDQENLVLKTITKTLTHGPRTDSSKPTQIFEKIFESSVTGQKYEIRIFEAAPSDQKLANDDWRRGLVVVTSTKITGSMLATSYDPAALF